ncbi:MAG: SagB/ThcOx family dehydrogenase [Bryobacterales bacterium]|nr:SagB/ThcOx family dehydrogenase [Bryobacterales bacterium]
MRRSTYLSVCLSAVLALSGLAAVSAQESTPLPDPEVRGGKPLMEALSERMTRREFAPDRLSAQVLSNLLWAAFGINRPDGRRTAPSASNMQEIGLYAVMADGAFIYDAKEHALRLAVKEDLRAATGSQEWIGTAPLELVFVADYAKMGERPEEDKRFYSGVDTGFISQNVYLFCASEGLATVVRGGLDRAAVGKALKLRPDQRIVLVQTVGWPAKK